MITKKISAMVHQRYKTKSLKGPWMTSKIAFEIDTNQDGTDEEIALHTIELWSANEFDDTQTFEIIEITISRTFDLRDY